MNTVSKAMLGECLLKNVLAEIKEIEALDYSHITASQDFKERIRKTIIKRNTFKHNFSPKRIAIILVSAILVSIFVMFAISAKTRDAVSNFFVQAYDNFVSLVIVKNDNTDTEPPSKDSTQQEIKYPTTIETVYLPSYIKANGYEQLDKTQLTYSVLSVWSDGVCIIDFSQSVVNENHIVVDTEDALLQSASINGQEVFYKLKHGVYTVVWIQNGYNFLMCCDEVLGWTEIEKIILSLEPMDN